MVVTHPRDCTHLNVSEGSSVTAEDNEEVLQECKTAELEAIAAVQDLRGVSIDLLVGH